MKRIEFNTDVTPATPWDGAELAVHVNSSAKVTRPEDVCTYCTGPLSGPGAQRRQLAKLPTVLEDEIRATLAPDVRAMVGNLGCELTFRYMTESPESNITQIIRWADEAYRILGSQLVLAPFSHDLVDDTMTGGRLLTWAADHKIPLILFCGYRFLFCDEDFSPTGWTAPFPKTSRYPYRYPFMEISETIKQSEAQVWTGVGFLPGLRGGSMEKAEAFGYSGILTTRQVWNQWNEEEKK